MIVNKNSQLVKTANKKIYIYGVVLPALHKESINYINFTLSLSPSGGNNLKYDFDAPGELWGSNNQVTITTTWNSCLQFKK